MYKTEAVKKGVKSRLNYMELGNANETQNWVHKIKFCDYKQGKAGLWNNVIKKWNCAWTLQEKWKNEGHDCSHHHLVHLKESQRVPCKEDWRNRGMKGRRYVDIWTIGYTFCHLTMIWCCGLWRYWKKNWYMNDQCKSLGIAVANVQRQNWNCKNQNFWETEI